MCRSDGDLQTTDKIIDSIETKSGTLFAHYSVLFHESHVSNEMLKAVVDDYKIIDECLSS